MWITVEEIVKQLINRPSLSQRRQAGEEVVRSSLSREWAFQDCTGLRDVSICRFCADIRRSGSEQFDKMGHVTASADEVGTIRLCGTAFNHPVSTRVRNGVQQQRYSQQCFNVTFPVLYAEIRFCHTDCSPTDKSWIIWSWNERTKEGMLSSNVQVVHCWLDLWNTQDINVEPEYIIICYKNGPLFGVGSLQTCYRWGCWGAHMITKSTVKELDIIVSLTWLSHILP